MEGKLFTVADDSPFRCQAIAVHGSQCNYGVLEGLQYCSMHAGRAQNDIKQQKLRNYRLQQYRERINDKADNDNIKSLREEIGILRLIMEETINRCSSDTELLIYSPRLADLAIKIEKVVVSCHKLETSLGESLGKTAILNISTRIVNIISQYVKDENIITEIVNEISTMISES